MKKLIERIEEEKSFGDENFDIHQCILDIGYSWWQGQSGVSYMDMLDYMEKEFGSFSRLMINTGKLNQQVCNGGFLQYYDNGYADGVGGFMQDHDFDHPLTREIIKELPRVIEQYGDLLTQFDKANLQKFLEILKKFIDASIDTDKEIEEYDTYEDENGYEVEEMIMVRNDEYGQFTMNGRETLKKLDEEYYEINDNLMSSYIKLIESMYIKNKD